MEEKQLLDYAKNGMVSAIDRLKQDLHSLRAGRANSSVVEGLTAEAYGSQMRIKELATITTPEARQLLITPFDVGNATAISKAIDKANLGLRVSVEGKLIRVFFPELDESRRKDLVVQVHKKREDCKVVIRNVRREANEKLKDMKTAGLPEDDVKRIEKHIQDQTNHYCKEIDDISAAKEKEVMTV
jgi:ribosome recycling factor